jgi:integrase
MNRRYNGVFKRKNSPRYYFKVKDENGKWIPRSSGTTDYNLAKKRKVQAQREIEEGCLPNDRSAWTLTAAVDRWLKERKLRVSTGTYASDVTNTRHLKAKLGENTKLIKLADLSAIKRYQSLRLEDKISPKTINNEVLALSAILQDANLWHRVAQHYRPLKVHRSEIGMALAREQELKLLMVAQACDLSAVAPHVAVLSDRTGMRTKEVKHLRLGAIHLDGQNPYVDIRRSTTKTDAGNRYVGLDKVACWALGRLMARARSLGAVEPDHYLLPTLREKHTRPTDPLHGGTGYDATHPMSSWETEWKWLRKAAGLGSARFHDLRHTYITRTAEAGVPLPVIQAQVGHLSAAMVAYYTHISQGAIYRAVQQIEQNSGDLLQQMARFEIMQREIGGVV